MNQGPNVYVERALKKEAETVKELPLPEQIEILKANIEAIPKIVTIDPIVALKIIKHARENFPRQVSGQLFGLSLNGAVEISNCFHSPAYLDDNEEEKFQIEMINFMQEVNMESSIIGWYTSSRISNFFQKSVVESQLSYQDSPTSSAITLLYDPERSEQGTLSLRAFRLSDKFLELKNKNNITTLDLIASEISYKDIFTELPLSIKNSSLTSVLVKEMQSGRINCHDCSVSGTSDQVLQKKAQALLENSYYSGRNYLKSKSIDINNGLSSVAEEINSSANVGNNISMPNGSQTDFLDLPNNDLLSLQPLSSLEKSMEQMIYAIDDYIQDANTWMYWKRGVAKEQGRKQAYVARKVLENTNRESINLPPLPIETEQELDSMFKVLPEPSRLDAMLNISKLQNLSKQTTQLSGPAVTRLYGAFAVQDQ
ncbi:hypothetical protein BB560_006459 [Smittium megazygosporum]|uniref:MPN domain-containing protein n=1 Tax=Smittium megazygosporum TaxID=133381 RepID=A0A2T9Y364_9FUNG|nr:hypothetical protein BB560_006621 [Smittium megazygosporum]PVU87642.1 hypothetical protein BB560_006459 [Smittium megazygosporum]